VAKLHFHHSKLRKQCFAKNLMGKCQILKSYTHAPKIYTLPIPKPLKFNLTKMLRKITKIYSPISIQRFSKIIISDIYFNILIFEPDTKSIEHKHTPSAQHRLIITDTERFVTALVVGPQDYRHSVAKL